MAATIRDVAKEAGVSVATVSRVINNSSLISNKTKKKVRKIIRELGYVPYAHAKTVIQKNMRTIGLLLPDIKNIFYPLVIRGVEDTLEREDYSIFLCNTDESIDKEKKYLDTLINKGVEGIILLGTRPAKLKHNYIINISKELPVVMVNDYILGSNIYSVMTDEVEGAYSAINYLISLGHRKIAFINGNVDYTTYRYKYQGYERALADSGITMLEDYHIKETPYEIGGYRGTNKLLEMEEKPTAIFTASDQIAVGVYRAINKAGFKIPQDFSVIGYSGIPLSAELFPELSTVDQFPERTGKLAAQTLLRLISGEVLEQKRILIEPKLVIRNSCSEI